MDKYTIGVDPAKKGGDMQIGAIYFDEASSIPLWYRNPIRWFLFWRAMRKAIKQLKKHKAEGKVWTSWKI